MSISSCLAFRAHNEIGIENTHRLLHSTVTSSLSPCYSSLRWATLPSLLLRIFTQFWNITVSKSYLITQLRLVYSRLISVDESVCVQSSLPRLLTVYALVLASPYSGRARLSTRTSTPDPRSNVAFSTLYFSSEASGASDRASWLG